MDGWKDKGDQLTFAFQIFPNHSLFTSGKRETKELQRLRELLVE